MRITKLTLLAFLFLNGIIFTSCEKDVDFHVPEGHSKLFAFSEINTEDKIKVFVRTSIGVNTNDEFQYPKQGQVLITLFEDGKELENPGFRYIPSEKAFLSQGSFRPEAGKEYGLEVSFTKDNRIKPIFATTYIPNADSIEITNLKQIETISSGPNHKFSHTQAQLSFDNNENNYFILRMNGINEAGSSLQMKLSEIVSGEKAIYTAHNMNGMLIDASKLGGDLVVNITNAEEIHVSDNITDLDLELITITKEAYQFHRSFSKQIASKDVSISEPVISYSNFENGLGLFSGYSSSKETFEIE